MCAQMVGRFDDGDNDADGPSTDGELNGDDDDADGDGTHVLLSGEVMTLATVRTYQTLDQDAKVGLNVC